MKSLFAAIMGILGSGAHAALSLCRFMDFVIGQRLNFLIDHGCLSAFIALVGSLLLAWSCGCFATKVEEKPVWESAGEEHHEFLRIFINNPHEFMVIKEQDGNKITAVILSNIVHIYTDIPGDKPSYYVYKNFKNINPKYEQKKLQTRYDTELHIHNAKEIQGGQWHHTITDPSKGKGQPPTTRTITGPVQPVE